VFTCLAIPGINYFAIDAKPYALGLCCAAGAVYYLVRWLDLAKWRDAAAFLVLAALLWRVHQVYWPFYLVFGLYVLMRVARRDSRVSLARILAVFVLLALALLPVALDALALLREAGAHVIVAPPNPLDLWRFLRPQVKLIAVCGVLAWCARKFLRQQGLDSRRASGVVLVLAWWLLTPVTIFAFSRLSGASLFVPRYLSLNLAGAALTATLAAALCLPRQLWRTASIAMAGGALVFAGNWRALWPDHDPASWRPAAEYVNRSAAADTPVLCTSPFIEAVPPVWRPDYPLPGYLYAHLSAYPLDGKPYLLPFRASSEANAYAARLSAENLSHSHRFLIYGSIASAEYWREWLSGRLELQGWHSDVSDFGEIRVVVFNK